MTRRLVAAVMVSTALLIGALLTRLGAQDADVREIHIVVRDMTYFVGGITEANPTLRLSRGEKVRLVLTNEDRGYVHNFIAPVLGVSTPLLQHGKSQSIDFTVPAVAGFYNYQCGPHSEMMRGNIAIE